MKQKDPRGMTRWERRKEETRERILVAALDLFHKQGFDATSMEQIAEEVDIAKATLYSHFPVKEAIISEYMQRSLKESEPEFDRFLHDLPDTRSRLIAVAEKASTWVLMHKDILQAYITYRFQILQETIKDPSKRSGLENVFARVIKAGQEAGDLRADIRSEVLARHLALMHLGAVVGWLADQVNNPLLESLSKAYDLFLNGSSIKS